MATDMPMYDEHGDVVHLFSTSSTERATVQRLFINQLIATVITSMIGGCSQGVKPAAARHEPVLTDKPGYVTVARVGTPLSPEYLLASADQNAIRDLTAWVQTVEPRQPLPEYRSPLEHGIRISFLEGGCLASRSVRRQMLVMQSGGDSEGITASDRERLEAIVERYGGVARPRNRLEPGEASSDSRTVLVFELQGTGPECVLASDDPVVIEHVWAWIDRTERRLGVVQLNVAAEPKLRITFFREKQIFGPIARQGVFFAKWPGVFEAGITQDDVSELMRPTNGQQAK